MLKALVIYPNERTRDEGSLLQIARALAQKIEHTHRKIPIKVIREVHIPPTGEMVYVAVYELLESSDARGGRRERRNE